MSKREHLTADELILFLDKELDPGTAAAAESHVLGCGDCAKRLQSLKSGSDAYGQYREQTLEPALHVPITEWARLSQLAGKERRHRRGFVWAVACACGLALAVGYLWVPKQSDVQEVLTRAQATPERPVGTLLLTTGSQRFLRPALLESGSSEARFQHVQALFVEANYSWENPLSARSFAEWRRHLPQKEDSITSIQESGGRKFFRIQTRAAAGILRSAALTLRADSYHPTKADFSFQSEDPMELSEQTELPKNGPQQVQASPVVVPPKALETPATPEDELRVFTALDALGIEAEEPIDVKLDAGHNMVLVTGMGLPAGRRRELEMAMAALPHTAVRFRTGQRLPDDAGTPANSANSDDSVDESPAFRQSLQDRYGGAHPLQAATDKALDASNGLFARSHLLLLLAREFPPGVEAQLAANSATRLLSLRQRHVGAMEYALRQLKEELLPLLTDSPDANESTPKSWQNGAEDLFAAARNLDRLVSRLLAGRYTEDKGNSMLKELPGDLQKVETLVRAHSSADKR